MALWVGIKNQAARWRFGKTEKPSVFHQTTLNEIAGTTMSNMKEDILDAIKKTAKKNGGKPLGMRTFKKRDRDNKI